MAEIKSTIDLVMERTRDLRMSEEERKAAQTSEWMGKARGWIQRYLDDAIVLQTLDANLIAGEKDFPELREIVKRVLLDFLKLNADNGKIFRVFQEIFRISTAPIENIVAAFHDETEKEREKREELIRQELSDRGISGSAILPNPARNKSWTAYLQAKEEKFSKSVKAIKL